MNILLRNICKSVIVTSLCCFMTNSVLAEDRLDALPMGGIVLNPNLSKDVKLKQQKIKISQDIIKIEYVFLNPTDKILNGKLSFVLPKTPNDYNNPDAFAANSATWDETYYHLEREAINKIPISDTFSEKDRKTMLVSLEEIRKTTSFLNFFITVNDQKIIPKFEMAAKIGEKDVSNNLIMNKIPLSATFCGGQSGIVLEDGDSLSVVNNELKNKLKNLKLVNEYGEPIWYNQSTYSWDQTFKPNSPVKITLSYKPAQGYTTLSNSETIANQMKSNIRYTDDATRQRNLEDFCPSSSFVKFLSKAFSNDKKRINNEIVVREVDFINNSISERPIEEFSLEILPPKNGEISLCWPAPLKKLESGKYIANHKNFIPPKTIEVLFVTD